MKIFIALRYITEGQNVPNIKTIAVTDVRPGRSEGPVVRFLGGSKDIKGFQRTSVEAFRQNI